MDIAVGQGPDSTELVVALSGLVALAPADLVGEAIGLHLDAQVKRVLLDLGDAEVLDALHHDFLIGAVTSALPPGIVLRVVDVVYEEISRRSGRVVVSEAGKSLVEQRFRPGGGMGAVCTREAAQRMALRWVEEH
jgi:hypothetical protein